MEILERLPDIKIKKILDIGYHVVKITELGESKSKFKQIPYINCRFENDTGYIPQIFYVNDIGKLYLDKLFIAVDIYENEVDTLKLLNKTLAIKIVDDLKSERRDEKYFKKVVNFYKVIPNS